MFNMEGTDTGWMTVFEKKGLHHEAGLLENYGIDSETDMSLLDQVDLRNLVSQGLKPIQLKKQEHWCEAVCARTEKTLPSSLNTPTVAALLSSEALNVLTLPTPCATVVESVSDNAGQCRRCIRGDRIDPSSHSRKGRITRGRTHSTYLTGGSQTVQTWKHSNTCSV